MAATKILPVMFIVLFSACILGLILHYKFLALLKEKHPKEWERLGSPSLFTNNSIKNSFRTMLFLKNKEYLKTNDLHLKQTAQFLWRYILIYSAVFVVILFLFMSSVRQGRF